jgi:hypothetical protein
MAANAPMPAPRPIASVVVLDEGAELAVTLDVFDIALVERVTVALDRNDVALDAGLDDGNIVTIGNMDP